MPTSIDADVVKNSGKKADLTDRNCKICNNHFRVLEKSKQVCCSEACVEKYTGTMTRFGKKKNVKK